MKDSYYLKLNIRNLFIYYGGIFEWSLLQDTYGENNFPTTSCIIQYLQFKPISNFKDRF